LPELSTFCRAQRWTFSAAQIDLKENEWRFFSRSVGELLCGLWDWLYRKEVVAQSFIVWGVGWPNEGHGDRNLTWINLSSRLLYLLSIRAAMAIASTPAVGSNRWSAWSERSKLAVRKDHQELRQLS
jgi:hypothetical protein